MGERAKDRDGSRVSNLVEPLQEHPCCWLYSDSAPNHSLRGSLKHFFFFGLNSKHSCLSCEEQPAVLAVCAKFSGFLQDSSAGLGTGPRVPQGVGAQSFVSVPQGIHITVLQAYQFLLSSQPTHSPALAWPQAHPLSCQHSVKPSHVPGLPSWTPRGPGIKKRRQ